MFEKINDFLYPPRCPVCDGILYMEDAPQRPKVCPECLMGISIITPPYCMKCSKPLEADLFYLFAQLYKAIGNKISYLKYLKYTEKKSSTFTGNIDALREEIDAAEIKK